MDMESPDRKMKCVNIFHLWYMYTFYICKSTTSVYECGQATKDDRHPNDVIDLHWNLEPSWI